VSWLDRYEKSILAQTIIAANTSPWIAQTTPGLFFTWRRTNWLVIVPASRRNPARNITDFPLPALSLIGEPPISPVFLSKGYVHPGYSCSCKGGHSRRSIKGLNALRKWADVIHCFKG